MACHSLEVLVRSCDHDHLAVAIPLTQGVAVARVELTTHGCRAARSADTTHRVIAAVRCAQRAHHFNRGG